MIDTGRHPPHEASTMRPSFKQVALRARNAAALLAVVTPICRSVAVYRAMTEWLNAYRRFDRIAALWMLVYRLALPLLHCQRKAETALRGAVTIMRTRDSSSAQRKLLAERNMQIVCAKTLRIACGHWRAVTAQRPQRAFKNLGDLVGKCLDECVPNSVLPTLRCLGLPPGIFAKSLVLEQFLATTKCQEYELNPQFIKMGSEAGKVLCPVIRVTFDQCPLFLLLIWEPVNVMCAEDAPTIVECFKSIMDYIARACLTEEYPTSVYMLPNVRDDLMTVLKCLDAPFVHVSFAAEVIARIFAYSAGKRLSALADGKFIKVINAILNPDTAKRALKDGGAQHPRYASTHLGRDELWCAAHWRVQNFTRFYDQIVTTSIRE